MPATPTRTLNPLPFGDLEPHRFEDLIRQLAYDLRRWKSLEAVGRGGSDEGIDIRAVELYSPEEPAAEEGEEPEGPAPEVERLWIFQCKREKALSPQRIRDVVEESLASLEKPPHGFVLAAACDISKKARDAFREEMVARGIEEFSIWAKGELEDMLFQPKNDRLLFAYFGLSLHARRRSLAMTLRSSITRKKQLDAIIDEEKNQRGVLVLLRDPTDETYPRGSDGKSLKGRWRLCRAMTVRKPGVVIVLGSEHLAATTPDAQKWDAIMDMDVEGRHIRNELRDSWLPRDQDDSNQPAFDFWNEYIDEADRAYLKIFRAVPIDRILAIDPLGDGYYPVPHLLLEFDSKAGPFLHDWESVRLERLYPNKQLVDIDITDATRAKIFPKPLPPAGEVPKEFDKTGAAAPMSAGAAGKLGELLTAVQQKRKARRPAATSSADAAEKEAKSKLAGFMKWRDKVAIPVLSAFVERLRREGHAARVVTSSRGSPAHHWGMSDSVGLRVALHVGSSANPDYRATGHVVISISDRGWHVDLSPKVDEGRSETRYPPAPPAPPAENLSAEQLEGHVLGVLERLHANRGI